MSSEDIINRIDKNNSAEELNKNTQSIYVNDLVYVICKVFLFVVLGIIYVVFFKNTDNFRPIISIFHVFHHSILHCFIKAFYK